MKRRYVWDEQARRWVEWHRRPPAPRLMIIGDTHEPFRSMADGRMYDSKSAYRRSLRAQGIEEIGDQRHHVGPQPFDRPLELYQREVKEALEEVNATRG